MTHSQLEVMLAESQVAPDEVNELLDLLAPLSDVATEAPEPSAELEALFDEGMDAPVARARVLPLDRRRRGRGAVAGAVVLALSGVGATGLSAAANTLPSPLQHQVSKFSQDFLPFKLPEPASRDTRRAPDAAQAPKPGSVLRSGDKSREAGESAASRSLGQPRRTIKAAAAWIDHDSGRKDGVADRPRPAAQGPAAEQSTYSKPRASRPVEEPRPPQPDSEMNASAGSVTNPPNELKPGGKKNEMSYPTKSSQAKPDDPPRNPPGKHDAKPYPGMTEHEGVPRDRHDPPGKGKPGTDRPGKPGTERRGDDPGVDGGSEGGYDDNEPGSAPAEVRPGGSRTPDVLRTGLPGA